MIQFASIVLSHAAFESHETPLVKKKVQLLMERAHVLLCMLAYHVEHHMRDKLAPMLYDETDHEAAAAMRASIVAKAERSDAARRKQTTGRTDDGLPVHSFQTLLADLATYSRIQATTALNQKYVFTLHTRPTQTQQRAFDLLGINPDRTQ